MYAGYPRDGTLDHIDLTAQLGRCQLNAYAQRDIAMLWSPHLDTLHLHLPNLPVEDDQLLLLQLLPKLRELHIEGVNLLSRDLCEEGSGLCNGLPCLSALQQLQVLHLSLQRDLKCMQDLDKLGQLRELDLYCTGVHLWPQNLSVLTDLRDICIREADPRYFLLGTLGDQDRTTRSVASLCIIASSLLSLALLF